MLAWFHRRLGQSRRGHWYPGLHPDSECVCQHFKGQQAVFLLGRAFSIIGGLITDASPKSGELENEDEAWRAYLGANGLDVSEMGEPIETSWSTTVKQALEAAERE
ncbi:hypothetical protein JCM24511_05284 [Saitozyma sp. JCM 24511]|nr:hypothetical protein JCM24511_05284 [Saitozyma sp. JCM 24511]